MKTLILTPNRKLNCGMYQLAQDLAKELDGEIRTRGDSILYDDLYEKKYKQVITFLYPMHKHGRFMKENYGTHWIVYNQGVPPITKTYFPNFWRRQAMRYINWRNNITMQGADENWDVTEREQKPRWTEKKETTSVLVKNHEPYALYLGRTTDYKNYEWLEKTMKELNIPLYHPQNESDDIIYDLLSNAKMLVTASIWEGFGRPCNEAQALKVYTVCFNTGAHDRLVKYGSVVPNHNFELFKQRVKEFWYDGIEDRNG